MNKLKLIGLIIIMFFFKNSLSANYEKIFYDFMGQLKMTRFEIVKKVLDQIK